MTVSSPNSRMDYPGNGSTDTFAFTYRIFDEADLLVTRRDDATDEETTLVLNGSGDTGYTVDPAGVDNPDGGEIVLTGGNLEDGYTLSIRRVLDVVQETDLRNQGAYYAEDVERQFDRQVMIAQQQQDELDRSVKLPESVDPADFDMALPVPSGGSQILATNSTNDGLTLLAATDSVAFVGNPVVDHFDAGVGFTAGSTTSLTLSAPPGTKNNTVVTFDGVVQHKDTYSITSTTLTFTSAIPVGTLDVEVMQNETIVVSFTEVPDATDLSSCVTIATGSTASRTLADRAADVFHAKDYGAAGTGATDDTDQINAALAAADANGGGIVILPVGTFLVSDNLEMKSNVILAGSGPGTVLKCGADTVLGLILCESISHFGIRDLSIDGGGQTTDVSTGYKSCQAIRIEACTYFTVERVSIYKCGIKNAAAPGTDSAHAGLGVIVSAVSGECAYGVVRDCRVRLIAGGGVANGDGIEIGGYGTVGNLAHDILVENCWVSTCGRHCYSVSGEAASGLPRNITFRKCYGEKSALDGVDIEDATRTSVIDCNFVTCGNDQTYYDPATVYGSTYRLLAGVATNGSDCVDIAIIGCRFNGCHYGITYSIADGLTIDRCRFESGVREDLSLGGAQSPSRMLVTNCRFLSTGQDMQVVYFTSDAKDACLFEACTFAKLVKIGQSYEATFRDCNFLAGAQFVTTGVVRPTFDGCTFEAFAGSAITHSAISQFVTDCVIRGCRFIGAGSMVDGIANQYNCAVGWRITGNVFTGLTGAGITNSNTNGSACYSEISGNKFTSSVTGIVTSQGLINGVIANNVFESITGWCIDLSSISAGLDMLQMTVVGNVAGATVTNGLRISVTTGTWDWCIVALNNMHLASGTKWSLSAGNGNGATVNNLTT